MNMVILRQKGDNYLTPQEVIEKYPDLIYKYNWTVKDLGHFLKCRIIDGYYDRGKRSSMIKETSLRKLIAFLNSNLDSQKIQTA